MATYKGIKGTGIDKLASDPSPNAQNAGRVWYNTSSNTWKLVKGPGSIGTDGSWASGNTIPTPRSQSKGAGGPAAAIIFAGGSSTGGPGGLVTNEFDGTCWAIANSMVAVNTNCGGSGSAADAVAAGGGPGACQDWNGTSWAVANSLNTGRGNCGPIVGPGSAAQCNDGPSAGGATEQWDGTCWTTVPGTTINTYQERMGFGTQAAAVEAGGESSPASPQTDTEEWNGTSWSAGGALNNGRGNSSSTGGTQTAGIVSCGGPSPSGTSAQLQGTEAYDGSTWTVCEETTQPHGGGAVGGGESTASTQAAFYVAGGYTPAGPPGFHWYDETDQWTFDEYAVKAITTS